MDLRARFLALLVAALCAVGWVPGDRGRGAGEGVLAADGVGVLPGRRQSVSTLEVDLADDDPPSTIPDEAPCVPRAVAPTSEVPRAPAEPPLAPPRVPARERGPPSIA
jgi:hypothetical protein